MTGDALKTARDHITVACDCLGTGAADPRYAEPVRRLEAIVAALDRRDAATAMAGLPPIIGTLGELEFPPPGGIAGTQEPEQAPRPWLLTGVPKAVEYLEEALRVLRDAGT